MKTVRQDAWAEEDDLLLAEIILRHIREGSTQLLAFEEAGERLGRTAAACGYRWNACVRKQYAAAIEIAKAQRKDQKNMVTQQSVPTYRNKFVAKSINNNFQTEFDEEQDLDVQSIDDNEVTWHNVIRFLKQNKNEQQHFISRIRQLEKDIERYELESATLRQQYEQLQTEYQQLHVEHQTMTEDYKTLVRIMERARKLTFLESELEIDSSQAKEETATTSNTINNSADSKKLERIDV